MAVFLIVLMFSPLFLNCTLTVKAQTANATSDFYFGVDVAFESVAQTEALIDNISSYTNFFIIGCAQKIGNNGSGGGIYNETRLTIISQYLYDKGLNFIVYSDDPSYPSAQWLQNAKKNYGSFFMGIYYFDEPGGKQLDGKQPDQTPLSAVLSADNFTDAANQYVSTINQWLRGSKYGITRNFDSSTEYPLFTSDYGLYWYDYAAGYDTVFAEFGWSIGLENYSRQLNIALCRGAATAFNQDWGVMITWAYKDWPYMENGTDLYKDMILAYGNGAKYIVVFDSNANYTQNILQPDQLAAMKEFWQYTQEHPRTGIPISERTAYVLPQDFGYGFRNPNDTIWGLWNADWNDTTSLTFVADISMCVITFLQMLGPNLDIIYPNENLTAESIGYANVVYWNDNTIVPNMPPMPSQSPESMPGISLTTTYQNGSPLSVTTIELYLILVSILAVLAVAGAVKRFKRKQSNAFCFRRKF